MKQAFILSNILLPLLLIFVSCVEKNISRQSGADPYSGVEFKMPVIAEPSIPDRSVNITDFGALPDGRTLNTEAFKAAIGRISEKGGGRVIIPRGLWLTGPIILKSNIDIHTEEGALVIFSDDKTLYPLIETSFEGLNTVRCISPIYGKDLENISFTGHGIFDGSGDAWRPVKKDKIPESQWKSIIRSGGIVSENGKDWFPSEAYLEGMRISNMNVPGPFKTIEEYEKIKDFLRPVMVSLVNCKKVLIDGPVFRNSPAWCLHPLMCEDVIVRNTTVKNPSYSQNGDGIDVESCRNVLLVDNNFDVGDDAICIKSGKDADGRKRGMPTENMIIRNCVVYHGHGGVTIGSEMSGGVKNVSVRGCTFMGTDVGLRFKSNRGRGGVVENIYFSDINMIDIPTQAISFNMYYGGLSPAEMLETGIVSKSDKKEIPPVTDETPQFRNISFTNITCRGAMIGLFLQGLPELNLEGITLQKIDMKADLGMICTDADGISVKGLRLATESLPVIRIMNSKNIKIEDLDVQNKADSYQFEIKGNKTENIYIHAVKKPGEKSTLIGEEVNKSTVEIL
jgi:polygalacturonase